MLTTIQRTIARDILVTFAVSLLVITVFVMFIGVAREAFQQGLGFSGVAQLVPFATPNALVLAVPGTALFSLCSVYGRMSADNEFTVMQSVGISPIVAILPALMIATVLSVASVGIINIAFTWGFNGMQNVVMSSIEQVAYRVLERDRSFIRGPLTMTVSDVIDNELIDPTIEIRRPNGDRVTIRGRTAALTYIDSQESLQLRITDGTAKVGTRVAFHFSDTFEQMIPLGSPRDKDLLTANPSHMFMRDLPAARTQQSVDIRKRENEHAIRLGMNILTSKLSEIVGTDSRQRNAALRSSRARLHRLSAESQRRWASGFTCLALAMVGIPLAMRLRTSDTMTTFGIVFLPTLVLYYPIFALTLDMAKRGQIPAQGVWIANAVFCIVGVLMMRKSILTPA